MEVIEDIVKKLAPTPVTPLFTELPGETVWKVSKRVGSRFSVARSAENCAISPPRAGSWDHETKPVRSFQTVSRRLILGNSRNVLFGKERAGAISTKALSKSHRLLTPTLRARHRGLQGVEQVPGDQLEFRRETQMVSLPL